MFFALCVGERVKCFACSSCGCECVSKILWNLDLSWRHVKFDHGVDRVSDLDPERAAVGFRNADEVLPTHDSEAKPGCTVTYRDEHCGAFASAELFNLLICQRDRGGRPLGCECGSYLQRHRKLPFRRVYAERPFDTRRLEWLFERMLGV